MFRRPPVFRSEVEALPHSQDRPCAVRRPLRLPSMFRRGRLSSFPLEQHPLPRPLSLPRLRRDSRPRLLRPPEPPRSRLASPPPRSQEGLYLAPSLSRHRQFLIAPPSQLPAPKPRSQERLPGHRSDQRQLQPRESRYPCPSAAKTRRIVGFFAFRRPTSRAVASSTDK